MDPNPRPARASEHARHEGPRSAPPAGLSARREPARTPERASASDDLVTALWCPHCKTPFVGVVDPADASFVHPACRGRSVLDLALLDALAADSWFWQRYRERLRGQG